ncbi:hypothetical protein N7488_001006 [Penicillium malachiteum]|nr:hypothetical protein N7488_001006 [Penicillium malachiteum]
MAYNLTAEMFAEWAIGMVVIAIHLYARWKVGKGQFHWDDAFLGLVVIFWTLTVTFLYLCTAVHMSNIGLDTKTALEVPKDQISDYLAGKGLMHHRFTIAVSAFCVMTFAASMLLYLCGCRLIQRNWQIQPYAGGRVPLIVLKIQYKWQLTSNSDECTTRPMNYIIIETLSIVSDLAIMAVPIPMIIKAGIPGPQKLLLCLLFSSGIFVMTAAVLHAYYSVKDISTLSTALSWASREAFVSAFTVCASGIKPLVSNSRWFSTHGSTSGGITSAANGKRPSMLPGSKSLGRPTGHSFELSSALTWGKSRRDSSAESQENIIVQTKTSGDHSDGSRSRNEIVVTTDVSFSEERAEKRDRAQVGS